MVPDWDWEECYRRLIAENKSKLDMYLVILDGTHTPAKRGGEAVGYQGRKKCKTSNMLILTDKQGVPIGWSKPISGNHHDSFELRKITSRIFEEIEQNGISVKGLFLNADAGFDVKDFRILCKEKEIIHNIDFNKRRNKHQQNDEYMIDNEL